MVAVTLEVPDVAAAQAFYADAFGLGPELSFRATTDESSGFRGFTLSLLVAQPNIVDALVDSAVAAGASVIKPGAKSLWGYGGVVQAPDGAIWTIASSSKKNTGPATRTVDSVVLLLGVEDVAATKKAYVERGLVVSKSYGKKYVEFEADASPVKLALYGRKALAKNAGVPTEGSGSHRLVIGSHAEAFVDADGFVWEQTPVSAR